MNRQNLFADSPWDSEERGPETGLVHRTFWRPDGARMGATLWDLSPGASGMRMRNRESQEPMSSQPNVPATTASRLVRSNTATSTATGRTAVKKPATSPAVSAGQPGLSSRA